MTAAGRHETSPGASALPRRIVVAADVILAGVAVMGLAAVGYGVFTLGDDPQWGRIIIVAGTVPLAAVVAAAFLGVAWRANLALAAVAIGVPVYGFNALLMLSAAAIPTAGLPPEAADNPAFDRRTMREVVSDLRQQGTPAYPRAPIRMLLRDPETESALHDLLPLGGIARVDTVLCNESGTYTVYRADRHGFNNDDAAYEAPEKIRALVVGDSFAQGMCVPPGKDVAARLRARGVNAISVGNLANGPLLELASLVEYGAAWRPRVVYWLYYTNDLEDLREERESAALRSYLAGKRQGLIDRQPEIDALLKRIFDAEFFERSERTHAERVQRIRADRQTLATRLTEFATLYELRKRLDLDRAAVRPRFDDVMPLFERIVRAADATVRGWGGQMHFVYLPDWESFALRPSATRDEVLAIVRRAGIPVIDFEAVLHDSGDPLAYFPYRAPNHYTEEGVRLLADRLFETAPSGMVRAQPD